MFSADGEFLNLMGLEPVVTSGSCHKVASPNILGDANLSFHVVNILFRLQMKWKVVSKPEVQ